MPLHCHMQELEVQPYSHNFTLQHAILRRAAGSPTKQGQVDRRLGGQQRITREHASKPHPPSTQLPLLKQSEGRRLDLMSAHAVPHQTCRAGRVDRWVESTFCIPYLIRFPKACGVTYTLLFVAAIVVGLTQVSRLPPFSSFLGATRRCSCRHSGWRRACSAPSSSSPRRAS